MLSITLKIALNRPEYNIFGTEGQVSGFLTFSSKKVVNSDPFAIFAPSF